jgi:hypothetical protein
VLGDLVRSGFNYSEAQPGTAEDENTDDVLQVYNHSFNQTTPYITRQAFCDFSYTHLTARAERGKVKTWFLMHLSARCNETAFMVSFLHMHVCGLSLS